ncbi:unnamed protein product [Moneuplotes crassus]|uniref:Uncharacterized protein n=1 Tax=Euplotes crassus TaxID=5936 RepID=A0AAD2D6Y7_EUPCR|nr:unnamed protein product [Moneuplotes crassus]
MLDDEGDTNNPDLKIVFFTYAVIDQTSYYVCLNKRFMYCFQEPEVGESDKNYTIDYEINYLKITKVLKSTKKKRLLKIYHRDHKKCELNPLVLKIEDRGQFILNLACYWETCQMVQNNSHRDLPVHEMDKKVAAKKEDEFKINNDVYTIQNHSIFQWMMKNRNHYDLQKTDKYLLYNQVEGGHESGLLEKQIMIQISDPDYQVELLPHFNMNRDNLEEFAWNFTERIVGSENYGSIIEIYRSDPYFKKKNLSSDQAEWSGWEIHAKANGANYFITIERRKYIPPSMSNFCDFILQTKVKVANSNSMEGKEILSETLKEHQLLIDSLEPLSPISKIYRTIVQEKINSFLFDSDSLNFVRYQLGIKPYLKDLGEITKLYVDCIISKVIKVKNYDNFKPFKRAFKKEIMKNPIINAKKPSDFRKALQEKIKKSLQLRKRRMIAEDSHTGMSQGSGQNDQEMIQNIWDSKVAAYLAYCVDGGYYQSKFTLFTLIEAGKKAYDETGSSGAVFSQELAYLLDVRNKGASVGGGSNPALITVLKTLREVSGDYTFNEQVMSAILETNYAELVFEKEGDTSFYSFIRFLLETTYFSDEVQMCICRVIIKLFSENDPKKMGAFIQDESKRISAQQVVKPLIDCYINGRRALKEVACIALFNMGLSDKEYIEVMVSNDFHDDLIDTLKTAHHPLLFKSLKCLRAIFSLYKNLPVLLGNINRLFDHLKVVVRQDEEKDEFLYCIEIRDMIFQNVFIILKDYNPDDISKRENALKDIEEFVIYACREIVFLFQDYEPDEEVKDNLSLTSQHRDFNIRLVAVEQNYCQTLISLCIQYCCDDLKINDRKNMILKELGSFIIEKMYFQTLQAFIYEDQHKEMGEEEKDSLAPEGKLSFESWRSGCIGDTEIEYKLMRLLKILLENNSNGINDFNKRVSDTDLKVKKVAFPNAKEFLSTYVSNCPVKRICSKINDIINELL